MALRGKWRLNKGYTQFLNACRGDDNAFLSVVVILEYRSDEILRSFDFICRSAALSRTAKTLERVGWMASVGPHQSWWMSMMTSLSSEDSTMECQPASSSIFIMIFIMSFDMATKNCCLSRVSLEIGIKCCYANTFYDLSDAGHSMKLLWWKVLNLIFVHISVWRQAYKTDNCTINCSRK